jgi:hypothetical protein
MTGLSEKMNTSKWYLNALLLMCCCCCCSWLPMIISFFEIKKKVLVNYQDESYLHAFCRQQVW